MDGRERNRRAEYQLEQEQTERRRNMTEAERRKEDEYVDWI